MTRAYLPAAGRDVFLPFYDPLTRLLGLHGAMDALIEQAELSAGLSVLDVGCGTGTLTLQIATTHPEVSVTALDPDPRALERARRKAQRAGASITFAQGYAERLPFEDRSFDRVFSSMMFHHLRRGARAAAVAEMFRVLRPGGCLEVVDFAAGKHNVIAQLLNGNQLNAAAEERLLRRMAQSGFSTAKRTAFRRTLVGTIAYYEASRAA